MKLAWYFAKGCWLFSCYFFFYTETSIKGDTDQGARKHQLWSLAQKQRFLKTKEANGDLPGRELVIRSQWYFPEVKTVSVPCWWCSLKHWIFKINENPVHLKASYRLQNNPVLPWKRRQWRKLRVSICPMIYFWSFLSGLTPFILYKE